jgi:Domain of unknown function (DUF5666)
MRSGRTMYGVWALAICLLAALPLARAQVTHYLGSITAINGDTLTVKTDAGDVHQVQVPSTAQIKRVEPGQTDLSKAEPLDFSSLAVGDRVLVNLDPNASGSVLQAVRVVAIKKADVTKMQQSQQEEWAQGVHGLVKSVDAAAGVIVVSVRAGLVTKDVTVTVSKSTILKRYTSGSVSFDEAQPAPIDTIKPGDQISARGTKNPDGTALTADAVVSGSFLSVAGTVISTDTTASTVTVKDLKTKKPVTIHIAADAQLRRLDEQMATRLAARLKGGQGGAAGRAAYTGQNGGQGAGGAGGGQRQGGQGAGPGAGGAGMGDLEAVLDRAPTIQLASLQKNEAVMIVATEDSSGANAVKLLAGVEPLLEAPEAQDLLASWSLGGGEGEAAQ